MRTCGPKGLGRTKITHDRPEREKIVNVKKS